MDSDTEFELISMSNLQFPTITNDEMTIDDLQRSTQHLSAPNMPSVPSDVESLSSMNESAWDVVDERSAVSGYDGASEVSGAPTPVSEIAEVISLDSESLAGDGYGSDSPRTQNRQRAQFSRSRKDSSSDPPDTARPFAKEARRESILVDDQAAYIRFRETAQDEGQEVCFVLTEFDGKDKTRLVQEHKLSQTDEVAGTVRQRLSTTGLSPSGPFKIIYVGPTEMKETLINKVASALATSPDFVTRSGMRSSRVTVVPISAFADDSSPDVVLIDSVGIDMDIEECKSAVQTGDVIELTMDNSSTTWSAPDPSESIFELPSDYNLPHLAIVYVPAREHSRAKKLRTITKEFFHRHNIPSLLISSDTKWQSSSSLSDVDERLPHLAIEAFNTETGRSWTLQRQAIDVNTFISIDSAQLGRSLALLDLNPELSILEDSKSKILMDNPFLPTLNRSDKRATLSDSLPGFRKYGTFAFILLFCIYLMGPLYLPSRSTADPAFSNVVVEKLVSSIDTAGAPISMTYTTTISAMTTSTITQTQAISPITTNNVAIKVPVADLLKDNIYANRSDKFQVQVVGDNHVLLFAPTWFKKAKQTPKLKISVTRDDNSKRRAKQGILVKSVPHEFSALHTGVFAFKFPPEHAHGKITISISTTARPSSREKFQVDLGSAWLKISRWQRAASALKEIVSEDIFAARTGLLEAYATTNDRVQHLFKDAMVRADSLIKEAEKASIVSLSSTFQNTETLLTQTKAFASSLRDRLNAATESARPGIFLSSHESLVKDMSVFSKKLSSMFVTQAKSLAQAASGISAIGDDIQAYRETHFVTEQKRLLQVYWNVFGMPDHLKAQLEEKRQAMLDEEIWGTSCRKCKGLGRSDRRACRRARKLARG